jgi:hypothetical protein
LIQHRRNNMQICQGQGQGQGQHQFNQLNQCMRFPIEYNGLLCKTQSIQPTQSIQYIRYMPQYPICLVSDMNVINDFKILETYWTDSIGCICCIDWIVWIDCKSIQVMQPIQSNQPIQYPQWNKLNWLNWFKYVDFDLNPWSWICAVGFAFVCIGAPTARRTVKPESPDETEKAPSPCADGGRGRGAPQTHTSAICLNTDETTCNFARARARANINSVNWTNAWDSQCNKTLHYLKLNQCNQPNQFNTFDICPST